MGLLRLGSGMALVAVLALAAGCSTHSVVDQHARAMQGRMAAAAPDESPLALVPPPSADGDAVQSEIDGLEAPTLYFAPTEAAAEKPVPTEAKPQEEKPGAEKTGYPHIGDMTFKQVVAKDVREAPAAILRGFTYSFTKPENLIILGAAFGADRVVRHNWDEPVRHYFLRHRDRTSLSRPHDLGGFLGNPFLHVGIGLVWYGVAVEYHDEKNHEFARVLLEALIVNDATTLLLKEAMRDKCPNGERWGWPSGHTSSAVCIASVVHEYYGWAPAIPCYLVAGYSAATRLADREHDVSDLVFGAALGLVIGHSVVKGELPQIAGFRILPMGGDGAGVTLVKSW